MSYLAMFNATAQHYGEWLSGYNWSIIGCGTFRRYVSERTALAHSKRFFDRLGRKIKRNISYVGVIEHRYSGLGLPPIPFHLHFLAACPMDPVFLSAAAESFWKRKFGDAKVECYDASQSGAFYVSKIVGHGNGQLFFANLDRLEYYGAGDLLTAIEGSPYVPDRLKGHTRGDYLVLRNPQEKHSQMAS